MSKWANVQVSKWASEQENTGSSEQVSEQQNMVAVEQNNKWTNGKVSKKSRDWDSKWTVSKWATKQVSK